MGGTLSYLKHSQSKQPVQIAIGLHHCFTVATIQTYSGNAPCSLIKPVQQLPRHIYGKHKVWMCKCSEWCTQNCVSEVYNHFFIYCMDWNASCCVNFSKRKAKFPFIIRKRLLLKNTFKNLQVCQCFCIHRASFVSYAKRLNSPKDRAAGCLIKEATRTILLWPSKPALSIFGVLPHWAQKRNLE